MSPHHAQVPQGVLALGCACPKHLSDPGMLFLWRFEKVSRIGEGLASRVYQVTDTLVGTSLALKAYDLAAISDSMMRSVLTEISIHAALDHPHITPMWAAFREGDFLCVLMPLAENGDLYTRFLHIHHDERTIAKHVILPLLSALAYLHARGVIHRDVKLENILLDSRGSVQLADLGFAIQPTRRLRVMTQVGTLSAMAPEVLLSNVADPSGPLRSETPRDNRTTYDDKVDVWAFGVLCWELLCGTRAFHGDKERDIICSMVAGFSTRPEFTRLSPSAQAFLASALKWDPAQRLSCEELYSHQFVLHNVPLKSWEALSPSMLNVRPTSSGQEPQDRPSSLRLGPESANGELVPEPRTRMAAAIAPSHDRSQSESSQPPAGRGKDEQASIRTLSTLARTLPPSGRQLVKPAEAAGAKDMAGLSLSRSQGSGTRARSRGKETDGNAKPTTRTSSVAACDTPLSVITGMHGSMGSTQDQDPERPASYGRPCGPRSPTATVPASHLAWYKRLVLCGMARAPRRVQHVGSAATD